MAISKTLAEILNCFSTSRRIEPNVQYMKSRRLRRTFLSIYTKDETSYNPWYYYYSAYFFYTLCAPCISSAHLLKCSWKTMNIQIFRSKKIEFQQVYFPRGWNLYTEVTLRSISKRQAATHALKVARLQNPVPTDRTERKRAHEHIIMFIGGRTFYL